MHKKTLTHFIVHMVLLIALGISFTFFSAYIIRPPYSSVIAFNKERDLSDKEAEKKQYKKFLSTVNSYAKAHEANLFGLSIEKNILYYAGEPTYLDAYISREGFSDKTEGIYVGQNSPLHTYFVDHDQLKLPASSISLSGVFNENTNDFLFEIIGTGDLLIPVESELKESDEKIILWYVPNTLIVDFLDLLEKDFPTYTLNCNAPYVRGWAAYLKDSFSDSYSMSLLALSIALVIAAVYYTLRYYRDRAYFLSVHLTFGRSKKREFLSQMILHGLSFILSSLVVGFYSYYVRFGSMVVWRRTWLIFILFNFLIALLLPLILELSKLRSAGRA